MKILKQSELETKCDEVVKMCAKVHVEIGYLESVGYSGGLLISDGKISKKVDDHMMMVYVCKDEDYNNSLAFVASGRLLHDMSVRDLALVATSNLMAQWEIKNMDKVLP